MNRKFNHPLIVKAGLKARHTHRGQLRKLKNVPYYHHPFRVAREFSHHSLATVEGICVALLHDTHEDHGLPFEIIAGEFGAQVAASVANLTKPEKKPGEPREDYFERVLEKVETLSTVEKVIKLFDRLDNVRESIRRHDPRMGRYLEETLKLLPRLADADFDLSRKLERIVIEAIGS